MTDRLITVVRYKKIYLANKNTSATNPAIT